MFQPKRIYLAGPEVFLPNARKIGAQKTRLCTEYGFEGLFPLDNNLEAQADPRKIYLGNVAQMQVADLIIANLTPFRGDSADVGTVFELGMIAGLGKPALGYTNDGVDLAERLRRRDDIDPERSTERHLYDRAGRTVENFGFFDNLMLACCLEEVGIPIVRRSVERARLYTDLDGFVECLQLARKRWPS